jgi:SAM-dependent methyltransferase
VSHDPAWEDHAEWWIELFTEGADPEYAEQIMPLAAQELAGCRRVLDVGCGEGQITRLAATTGAALTVGIDPTWNQLVMATKRAGTSGFARGVASALPFSGAAFEAVVACLVFEHIDDVDLAIAEVSRVLAPGGRFCLFLNHPFTQTPDSGWIDDRMIDPPEQYWRIGPYLPEAVTIEEIDPGVHVRFVHRPLSRYVNALAANGLYIERMVEPAPPPGFLALAPEYGETPTVPRLLYVRAAKLDVN